MLNKIKEIYDNIKTEIKEIYEDIRYEVEDNLNFWPFAMITAILQVLGAIISLKKHHPMYFVNLFYYFDILLNVFTKGHPYITVSARVGKYGYKYNNTKSFTAYLWRWNESCINWAFKYLDGKSHCNDAFIWATSNVRDNNNKSVHIQHGGFIGVAVLTVFVSISTVLLWLIINTIGRLFAKEYVEVDEDTGTKVTITKNTYRPVKY